MDEYLQYMKTLRSQMNDVEDQAVKLSVEEQMQITTIQTMEKDVDSAKSEAKRLKHDADQMVKEKGQICLRILDKQKKIASLECDSSTLTQTLELIQQEKISLSAKITEYSTYYSKVSEALNAKLQEQKDWIKAHASNSEVEKLGVVKQKDDDRSGEIAGKTCSERCFSTEDQGDEVMKNLVAEVAAAKAKLEETTKLKSQLISENTKIKQSVVQLKCLMDDFKPEFREMDIESLQEEHEALLSDKSGETEYLLSLQNQIEKLKGISHTVKCSCGNEYKVEMGCCP